MTDAEKAALLASLTSRDRPTPAPSGMLTGLPAPLTSLIGRDAEAAEITALIHAGARLLTLTGPGGVGKTALALRVAADLEPTFGHGAVFVPLATIRDPELVAPTLARTVGVGERGVGPLTARLRESLRDRHLLLVLDNLEHVLAAAPVITDLLSWCPHLVILTTSRVSLRLSGEQLVPVPPLEVPDPDRLPPRDELAAFAAVRLYVARARAIDPAFKLTDANAGAVAAICHRLDGLPLALELAAAQSAVLTPAALLPLMARRLPLLSGGRRDAPARQRTLRDAIAWSYDLLSPDEKCLFRALAVFVGGVTLEAATEIATAGSERRDDAYACLSTLVDHSLLRLAQGPGGAPRYLTLETIREFALERLDEAGETAAARNTHAAWFAGLDDRLDPNRIASGERFDDRLLQIEADTANYRAALAHLAAIKDAAGVLRLAGALAAFWHHRGHLREARQWLEWALARTEDADPGWRGRAIAGLSLITWSQGDAESAAALAEDAHAIAEAIDDHELRALAVHMRGLNHLARGQLDRAEDLMLEALRLERAIGIPGYGAMALANLAGIAHQQGDLTTGARRAEEALAMFTEVGHASGAAMALCTLASLAADRGDDREALSGYQDALRQWASIGERWAITGAFRGIAALAAAHGHPEQAAILIGVIDARLDESGAGPWLSDRPRYEWAASTAREALGNERFADLRHAGRALPFAAAVALGVATPLPDVQPSCSPPDSAHPAASP
jgi:non-specific serine/threonine protein kinase